MSNLFNPYSQYASNQFSQFGEDGILEKLLEHLPDLDSWCVEFGAWDGIFLSNTFNLIKNKKYKSVLIEADPIKFKALQKNLAPFQAILVNEFVSFSGENTLDQILSRTKIPKNFDVLSIDIDGNDFYILESLMLFKPKIICIEFNPTIPNEVEFVQKKDFKLKQGCSALSLLKLAQEKGYLLACVTHCNLILVDTVYSENLKLESADLNDFRQVKEVKVFAFSGYDGSIHLSKPLQLTWHGIKIGATELQFLPKIFRHFPGDFGFLRKVIFGFYLLFNDQADFVARVKKHVFRTR